MKYKTIIGLETHIELKTKQKMFCGCSADYFGEKPNSHVCPVCLGLPGALPIPNYQAVRWTILIGLALNCQINRQTYFERKHYFYPDLPKGYQISQYAKPLCYNGYLLVNGERIKINRVHLEEDTGKLIHGEQSGEDGSYLDFNRGGVPLVEIVTEPDLDNSLQAAKYLKQLQQIVQYLGVSDCDMEKGSMRCEPNISMINGKSWQGQKQLPKYKVEIKNINSFRFVQQAIAYEEKRQALILDNNQLPTQETRRYVESKKQTETMRTKEFAQDYRYFPEPDIPPLSLSETEIKQIKEQLQQITLPHQRLHLLTTTYQLNQATAQQLTDNKVLGDKYLAIVKQAKDLDRQKLANLLVNGKISTNLDVYEFVNSARKILSKQKVNPGSLEETINSILQKNEKAVIDFSQGKQSALQFLLGQCLKTLGRNIDINQLRDLLLKKLMTKE